MAALLPRQESGKDLDTTRCFSSLGKGGSGKGTSFFSAMGCGSQGLLCTQNNDGMLVWGLCGSGLGEGTPNAPLGAETESVIME